MSAMPGKLPKCPGSRLDACRLRIYGSHLYLWGGARGEEETLEEVGEKNGILTVWAEGRTLWEDEGDR